jgi:lipid-A-disaccharide synthase
MSLASGSLRIGIVAGEASGDVLGAGLIHALRQSFPNLVVEGIGGPRMIAEGCRSFFPQERLAVMGLVEPLRRLPELLGIRRFLKAHFLADPPDVFIGIDSPDFNLPLECTLKSQGIRTAHYVSPSVWAWRQGRLKKIARSADLMLTLFPFEEAFYLTHKADCPDLNVVCVGHTLADHLPLKPDIAAARVKLGLTVPPEGRVVALLPGSRAGEVERMGTLFLQVAQWCLQLHPGLQFVLPAATPAREQQLSALLCLYPDVPVKLVSGQSHDCMAASDVVLMASGTTTLEAMLLKKPMVVAYRLHPVSHFILSRLIRVPHVSLPNLLAQEKLVPEFLQDEATVSHIGAALIQWLDDADGCQQLVMRFRDMHLDLRRQADTSAAHAILQLAGVK